MLKCRQKTRDFVASCRNLKNDKPCSINYCFKCLSNRLCNVPFNVFFRFYIVFLPTDLVDFELDMERKQKRWHCWRIGSAQSAETFAIAVCAGQFLSFQYQFVMACFIALETGGKIENFVFFSLLVGSVAYLTLNFWIPNSKY